MDSDIGDRSKPLGQDGELAQTPRATQTRLASLDAARGLFALAVFFGHATGLSLDGRYRMVVSLAEQAARYSVLGFFCLSGFAIAMSLTENHRRGFSILSYMQSRVFRVAPPLLAVAAVVWILGITLELVGPAHGIKTLAARPQYVMALLPALGDFTRIEIGVNSPLWSLVYEVHLYVIAGVGTWLFTSRDAHHRLVAMVLLIGFLLAIDAVSLTLATDGRTPYFLAFGFGAVAYWKRDTRADVLVVLAVVALLAAITVQPLRNVAVGQDARTRLWIVQMILIAIVAAAVITALSRSHILDSASSLGAWSYTLYIVHYPLVLAIDSIAAASTSPSVVWIVGVPTALAVAYGLGRMCERPKAQQAWVRRMLKAGTAAPRQG